MPHLFLANIGPVQDFIASARRSRDLWFGSWLLSELSKAAARTIADRHGLESLIFPAPPSLTDLLPDSTFNVANKILALILDTPGTLGTDVKAAIDRRLESIRQDAFGNIHGELNDSAAQQQIADLVEYYWVTVPLADESSYPAARSQVEALMAARKVTQEFGPVPWGDGVPKSSLDGLRESVIPENVFDRVRRGEMTERELRENYGVRRGERLDGVGLLKRHGQMRKGQRFFSTSHVAALPLLARLPAAAAADVNAYVGSLKNLGVSNNELGDVPGEPHPAFARYDGHLLFEERLAEFFDGAVLASARAALATFLKQALGSRSPEPYYALLLADGDRMGQAIDHVSSARGHRKLSQTLAGFAGEARDTVQAHGGSLVYAGGDDVLAFMPLHRVLSCASVLARQFAERMDAYPTAAGLKPTLSVGIAVAHHIEPLSDTLTLARRAERAAKVTRNALAVTVSKRSGVDRTVSGPWGTLDGRLALFIDLHRADAVPDGAAYDLQAMSRHLTPHDDAALAEQLQKVQRKEAIRILERKQPEHGRQEQIAEKALKQLVAMIDRRKTDDDEPVTMTDQRNIRVDQLADELIVSRLFADALATAEGD